MNPTATETQLPFTGQHDVGNSAPGYDAADIVRVPVPATKTAPPVAADIADEPLPTVPLPDLPAAGEFDVEVIRSARRKKTVGATLKGNQLTVTVPTWMTQPDIDQWVEEMTKRWSRKVSTETINLVERAKALAARYDLPTPESIGWSSMDTQWGSCTPARRTIRLSTKLATFPRWVLDYVIVHELSHIAVPDHSANFWKLVHRYPRTERARGYLIAKSGDDENE
jgi:predicted metal-dependent hydrolase